MNLPYDKIYFILYYPGGCGSLIQNLLQTSKKYSNNNVKFDYSDGTAHTVKNDCFNNFHGIDINDPTIKNYNVKIQKHKPLINALKNYNVLNTYLEKNWKELDFVYYSNRISSLTFYPIIDLLPLSKFIYCRINPIVALKNLDTKILTGGIIYNDDIGSIMLPTHKKNMRELLLHINYYHITKKAIEKFIINKKSKNVLILDVFDLIYNDNTAEIDKLIKFCNMDVDREVIVKLIHLYRDAQNNLVHNPIWDKFLIAYDQLNK